MAALKSIFACLKGFIYTPFSLPGPLALFSPTGILILLLILSFDIKAQERHVIHGIVYEKESEMPLAGAHIHIEGSSFGTISGPDGSFRLSIAEFPVSLKVSFIGYEDRIFTITEDLGDEVIMLGIRFSAEMLDAVTITDKKVELIFKDNTYSVLDFEFHENGLMLLIFRNRLNRAELVLLSNMNDTLALLTDLPGKAQSLHHDCMDFIHYLSKDTAYQIHFTGSELRLDYPVHIKFFKPVADAFVAFHHDNYYFGIKSMNNLMIEYIRYDSISGTYDCFKQIYDKEKLQVLKDNPWHRMLIANPVSDEQEFSLQLIAGSVSIKQQMDALEDSRDASIEGHYLRKMVYTAVYAPLFKSDGKIIIFNHPEGQIEFLSIEGEAISAVPINYHHKKNWETLILKDEIRDEYYTIFIDNSRASLRTINVHSGTLGSPNILHYPFVEKILVRNGYAYFTYRQPGSIERMMLFRQKLKLDDGRYVNSNSH